jgi:hypothetical protein
MLFPKPKLMTRPGKKKPGKIRAEKALTNEKYTIHPSETS